MRADCRGPVPLPAHDPLQNPEVTTPVPGQQIDVGRVRVAPVRLTGRVHRRLMLPELLHGGTCEAAAPVEGLQIQLNKNWAALA
ncbi:hypothetical protein Acsp04_51300 [Actinomadura sp. NBRC 104425]|nr:hypothetical protein Acsp04_51300 [Actinomadura sp. NBRC 104425]